MSRMLQRTLRSVTVGRRAVRLYGDRVEGAGRRIKAHVPRHCACERCIHGLEHLPLQSVAA